MASNKRAGTIFIKKNGVQFDAAGEFTYNLGLDKNEELVGPEAVHGYKSVPQAAFIEGEIFDSSDLDFKELCNTTDATITLQLANGKIIVLHQAWWSGDGNASTGDAKIKVKFTAKRGEEIKI